MVTVCGFLEVFPVNWRCMELLIMRLMVGKINYGMVIEETSGGFNYIVGESSILWGLKYMMGDSYIVWGILI